MTEVSRLLSMLILVIMFEFCKCQCPAASFPKVISGSKANGITTIQSIDIDNSGNNLLAGGYSNELDSSLTTDFFPWIARFRIARTSADPVLDFGVLVKSLPNNIV